MSDGRTAVIAAFVFAGVSVGAGVAASGHHSPPYHRNASDAAACRAYATAVIQATPLATVDAVSAGAYATSPEISDLIDTAFQRYGSQVAPVDWCNDHGYTEHPLGLGE